MSETMMRAVRWPTKLVDEADALAVKEHRSFASLAVHALDEYMARRRKLQAAEQAHEKRKR